MTVRVLYFAVLRERVGRAEESVSLPESATVDDLWSQLSAATPQLHAHHASLSFAVNQEYVQRSHALHDGDEVALIPPVSGG